MTQAIINSSKISVKEIERTNFGKCGYSAKYIEVVEKTTKPTKKAAPVAASSVTPPDDDIPF